MPQPPFLPSDAHHQHSAGQSEEIQPDSNWTFPQSLQPKLRDIQRPSTWSTFPSLTAPFDSLNGVDTSSLSGNVPLPPMMGSWGSTGNEPMSMQNQQLHNACSQGMQPQLFMPPQQPQEYLGLDPNGHQLFRSVSPQPPAMPNMANPYTYNTSASMSALPSNSFGPIIDRRMSSPMPHSSPYVHHPLPARHSYQAPGSGQRVHPAPAGSEHMYDDGRSEHNKPPRFKPTKEQLVILIDSYNQNKNPDAAGRESLARQLGPEVRPKTLQIWFQNRRSKSRAKERESLGATPPHLSLIGENTDRRASTGAFDPFVLGGSGRKGSLADLDSLRAMAHDADPALQIAHISVLSIGAWTRFLTPGLTTSPDLCLAVKLQTPTPGIFIYVSHNTETYRIRIPLRSTATAIESTVPDSKPVNTITSLEAAANPTINAEAVLIRFDLSPAVCTYASWNADFGTWLEINDFSGGAVTGGGKVEITGQKETLLPVFAQIHQYLCDAPLLTPVTFSNHQASPSSTPSTTLTTSNTSGLSFSPLRLSTASHLSTTFGSNWRFPAPSTATSADNTPVELTLAQRNEIVGVRVRPGGMGHAKQRSLSAPIFMPPEYEAGRADMTIDQGMASMVDDYGWGQGVTTAKPWARSVASDQPEPGSQQYQNFGMLDNASWPYQLDGNPGQANFSPNLAPGQVPYPLPAGPRSNPSNRNSVDHSRYSSMSSNGRRERGNSAALSLISGSSGTSLYMMAGREGEEVNQPYMFDTMTNMGKLDVGGSASGEGEMLYEGQGMDMEVLDEDHES